MGGRKSPPACLHSKLPTTRACKWVTSGTTPRTNPCSFPLDTGSPTRPTATRTSRLRRATGSRSVSPSRTPAAATAPKSPRCTWPCRRPPTSRPSASSGGRRCRLKPQRHRCRQGPLSVRLQYSAAWLAAGARSLHLHGGWLLSAVVLEADAGAQMKSPKLDEDHLTLVPHFHCTRRVVPATVVPYR